MLSRKMAGALCISVAISGCAQTKSASAVNDLHSSKQQIEDLIVQASYSPQPAQRADAALAAAELSTSSLADTVRAIDAAKQVVFHNMRNADTVAFKSARAVVQESVATTQLNLEQGQLRATNRPLDVAIQGPGFFRVKVKSTIGDGFAYTRNGNFLLNAKGELIVGTGDGYKIDPPICIPPNSTDISIENDGRIFVVTPDLATRREVAQIHLYSFVNAEGLNELSASLYQTTCSSGPVVEHVPGEDGVGQIVQGWLENSNVDLLRERLRLQFLVSWRETLVRSSGATDIPKR